MPKVDRYDDLFLQEGCTGIGQLIVTIHSGNQYTAGFSVGCNGVLGPGLSWDDNQQGGQGAHPIGPVTYDITVAGDVVAAEFFVLGSL
jgi:hypothetical protein